MIFKLRLGVLLVLLLSCLTAARAAEPGMASMPFVDGAAEPDWVPLNWFSTWSAAGYRVERREGTAGVWETVAVTAVNEGTGFIDRTVRHLSEYHYRITAFNLTGDGQPSEELLVTTPDRPIPEPLEGARAAHARGPAVRLSWYDRRFEAGYRIERRSAQSSWEVVAQSPPDEVEYVDHRVVANQVYVYRVVAFNEHGDSASPEMKIRAAAVRVVLSDDFEPGIDSAMWSDVEAGAVVADGNAEEQGHVLRMSGGQEVTVTMAETDISLGGWLRFRIRGGNRAEESAMMVMAVTKHGVSGLGTIPIGGVDPSAPEFEEWRTYEFEVPSFDQSPIAEIRFYQAGTNVEWWEVDDIEFSTPMPDAPPQAVDTVGLKIEPTGANIAFLYWEPVDDASAYLVERRSLTSDWEIVAASGFSIYPGPLKRFADENLDPLTQYFYRVTAVNPAGKSTVSGVIEGKTISGFDEWRLLNLGSIDATGAGAPLEDHGTGIPNLLRFAFGMKLPGIPLQPFETALELPTVSKDAGSGLLRVEFNRWRPEKKPGIRYEVEFSSDFAEWRPAGRQVDILSAGHYGMERVVWEDDAPLSGMRAKRFARVRVTEE